MSRIRSIHPGLFTDPEFVQVSMPARMALIGIWTEADDRGVFEWKPLTLKMRIFPGDAVDMDALLGELVSADRIRHVEIEGKHYGICRNFCTYQRPKNPSYRLPFSPAWSEFVGIKETKSTSPTPALPQEAPTTTEKPPQMEDGVGEKEEEERKKDPAPSALALETEFEKFWEVYPKKADRGHALKAFRSVRKRGVDLETLVAGAIRYRDDHRRDKEFTKNAQGWLSGECWRDEAATAPPPKPENGAENEEIRLRAYQDLIRLGRSPGLGFTNVHRAKMLQRGMVTADELTRVGA